MKTLFARGGFVAILAATGLGVFATAASAHDNHLSGTVVCSRNATSAKWVVSWRIVNDFHLNENVAVTAATHGLGDVSPIKRSIGASPNYAQGETTSGVVTQILASTTTGTVTLSITATWHDHYTTVDSASVVLPRTSCAKTAPSSRSSDVAKR